MSAEALVRMVLFAESLALGVGITLLVAHAIWWWWYDRWIAGRVAVLRSETAPLAVLSAIGVLVEAPQGV